MAEIRWNNIGTSDVNNAFNALSDAYLKRGSAVQGLGNTVNDIFKTAIANTERAKQQQTEANTQYLLNQMNQINTPEQLQAFQNAGFGSWNYLNTFGQNIDRNQINQALANWGQDVNSRASSLDSLKDYSNGNQQLLAQINQAMASGDIQTANALMAQGNFSNRTIGNLGSNLLNARQAHFGIDDKAIERLSTIDATRLQLEQQRAARAEELRKANELAKAVGKEEIPLDRDPLYVQLTQQLGMANQQFNNFADTYNKYGVSASNSIAPIIGNVDGGDGSLSDDQFKAMYQHLTNRGLSHSNAVGILGNILAENGGQFKYLNGVHTDGKNKAHGLLSWQGGREKGLYKHLAEQGLLNPDGSIKTGMESVLGQLDYLVNELQTTEGNAGKKLASINDSKLAAQTYDKLGVRSAASNNQKIAQQRDKAYDRAIQWADRLNLGKEAKKADEILKQPNETKEIKVTPRKNIYDDLKGKTISFNEIESTFNNPELLNQDKERALSKASEEEYKQHLSSTGTGRNIDIAKQEQTAFNLGLAGEDGKNISKELQTYYEQGKLANSSLTDGQRQAVKLALKDFGKNTRDAVETEFINKYESNFTDYFGNALTRNPINIGKAMLNPTAPKGFSSPEAFNASIRKENGDIDLNKAEDAIKRYFMKDEWFDNLTIRDDMMHFLRATNGDIAGLYSLYNNAIDLEREVSGDSKTTDLTYSTWLNGIASGRALDEAMKAVTANGGGKGIETMRQEYAKALNQHEAWSNNSQVQSALISEALQKASTGNPAFNSRQLQLDFLTKDLRSGASNTGNKFRESTDSKIEKSTKNRIITGVGNTLNKIVKQTGRDLDPTTSLDIFGLKPKDLNRNEKLKEITVKLSAEDLENIRSLRTMDDPRAKRLYERFMALKNAEAIKFEIK